MNENTLRFRARRITSSEGAALVIQAD